MSSPLPSARPPGWKPWPWSRTVTRVAAAGLAVGVELDHLVGVEAGVEDRVGHQLGGEEEHVVARSRRAAAS